MPQVSVLRPGFYSASPRIPRKRIFFRLKFSLSAGTPVEAARCIDCHPDRTLSVAEGEVEGLVVPALRQQKNRYSAIRIRRTTLVFLLAIACLLTAVPLPAQQTNQQKAHALLATTIQALGGPAWLDVRSGRMHIRTAKFFQGAPTGTFQATDTIESPDKERLDVRKQHVIQIFSGGCGWEITYKGKRKLSPQEYDKYRRLKSHTVGRVLGKWYDNPATVLIDEGPSQVNRHVTEKIKLINPANDAVILEIDAESHLPLRLSYEWRDPRFHDKNIDAVELDNYQRIDGIATPFTVTRTHNGEIVSQNFLRSVQYNITLSKDFFDPDVVAAHLK